MRKGICKSNVVKIKLMFDGLTVLIVALLLILASCSHQKDIREETLLNDNWVAVANDTSKTAYQGFERPDFQTTDWMEVNVPHNWDDYGGYRRLMHGNRHGYAWYRKKFKIENPDVKKQYFLFFEGVGSYATVWLNGDSVGYHAGGRTTFTLDITPFINIEGENILAVRADHPANIRDLPWVCGGCSPEWGFCEGSQPMGIFRPVHLIATNKVRVEPFGVHVWNDETTTTKEALLNYTSEIKNYGNDPSDVLIKSILKNKSGETIVSTEVKTTIEPGETDTLRGKLPVVKNPTLWSLDNPYLYTLNTEVWQDGKCIDRLETPYGIRTIKWDIFGENSTNRFYLNNNPVFINGTCEYEHMLGQGHAFSDEQVQARVEQMQAMGFNAFRDAHQPHNFRYHEQWDKTGMLWWTQMTAHIWFDNPDFRKNFKQLLHDWVKERRNSPSLVLWGLENESTLPEDFARECTEMIRELDPTSPSQRLVTTCNGGSGTDWNVIQNWSGTYGGDPYIYDEELSEQLLNGEYGAWRSIDFHTEGGFVQDGSLSEDRMTLLMETKVRLGEKVSDKSCGQFHWLFSSHDNPGRVQSGEGFRDIDRLGPINYKGAVTIWGEPLDVFYMFRSNYAPNETEPMVYIASHTWPDRWIQPGVKDGIRVYSNCDEVELFNSVDGEPLGKLKRGPIGTHFIFDNIGVKYNILKAVGYVNGKEAASDIIMLHHLPEAPGIEKLAGNTSSLTKNDKANYIYRVNCGGPDYTDADGNVWMADRKQSSSDRWGSRSWTDDYNGMPAFYGSQRQTYDPIEGTLEWPLIQSFRYGRHKLSYHFPLPNGEYQVELYFVEPWYGTGGGLDCEGWRIFDVAVNNKTVIDDLDIWKEAGHDKLLKRTVNATVTKGELIISFPEVKSGQAVLSALAVSTHDETVKVAPESEGLINSLHAPEGWNVRTWMNTGDKRYSNNDVAFSEILPVFYGAEWLQAFYADKQNEIKSLAEFILTADADVHAAINAKCFSKPEWLKGWVKIKGEMKANDGTSFNVYRKNFAKGETVNVQPVNVDGTSVAPVIVALPMTKLDDPIDLRETTRWQAEDGELFGEAKIVQYLGKTCVKVPDQNGSAGLQFSVGLASKYGLQFRFINASGDNLNALVQIIAADGRLMWSGDWVFPPTPADDWKSYRTNTQTTINAGTYTLKITPYSNGPLYFDWVKVQ